MLAHVPTRRALDWFLPASLGAAAAAVLAVGFVLGLSGRFGEPLGPPPASAQAARPRTGAFVIVGLGDSLTHGVGDSRGGYAVRVAEGLRRAGVQVSLRNLAVNGDETTDLLRRLDAPAILREVAGAHLVVVSAGGNDLSHALRGGGDSDVEPEAALARARAQLAEVVRRLRAANPTAPIRLIGLYNPFEVLRAEESTARAQLLAWNVALEQTSFERPGVLVVPTADLFADRPDRLAGDRFHPGPTGHAAIAERVLSTLREAEPAPMP
jgi:lysophospholipase L1-like esterase